MGTALGIFFEKSKVFLPAAIRGQMLTLNAGMIGHFDAGTWVMFKVFMSATGASLLSIAALERYGGATAQRHPAKKLALGLGIMGGYGANIVGGIIMGLGVTFAGACPGTAVAQLATGIWSAPYTLAGGLLGALTFGLAEVQLKKKNPEFHKRADAQFVDKAVGMPMWKLAMIVGPAIFSMVYFVEYAKPWQIDTQPLLVTPLAAPTSIIPDLSSQTWHPILGGILLGLLQVPAVLIMKHNLAVSGAFVTISGLFYAAFSGDRKFNNAPYFKNFYGAGDFGQVGTVVGILAGSYLSASMSGVRYVEDTRGSALSHVMAGALLLFGARMAGGCASGHGISGLGRLSTGSIATVGGMFAGGMLGALFL